MIGLTAAVMAMSAAQLFDLGTFVLMVGHLGPRAEVNPIVSAIFDTAGFPLVAIAKVALLAEVVAIVALLVERFRRPRLAHGIVAVGIVVGLAGGISNAIALGVI